MGIIIRQSFKATLVSYIGAIVGACSILFILPHCLSAEQIGLTRVLIETGLLFSFYAQMGMSNVAIKYFPYFKDYEKNHNGFVFLIVVIPLIGFIIFSIIFLVFKSSFASLFIEKSKLFTDYILYLIPITLFIVYSSVFEAYSSILQRIVVPKINKELLIRFLTIVLVLLFFFNKINLNQFVFLFVCVYGVAMVVNIIYINIIQPINLKPALSFINKPLRKEMLIFMVYMLITGAGSGIVGKIDMYMITSKISLADTGIFTIGFYIAAFIEMPSRSLFQISSPVVADALQRNDLQLVKTIYTKGSINQLLIGGFLFILIWANVDNIFAIMPHGEIYQKSKYVILFIGLSKVFDALTSINVAILYNSKYYYSTLYFIFLLAALAIVNNLLFIPIYGITGAAIATAASIFLYNAILVWFVWLKMKIQPFSKKTIYGFIALIILFVISISIHKFSNPYIDAIIRSSIISLLFLIVVLKTGLSIEMKEIINTQTRKIKFFNKTE